VRPRQEHIALSLPSDPKFLGILRSMVGEAADLFGFNEDERHELMLAVNEGCANIMRHCYQMDPGQKIDATIRIMEDRMEVELRDYGENQLDRDPEVQPCTGLRAGGLGVKLMKTVMDEVNYRPAQKEGTLLTMVKYRSRKMP
jgi:serine/threonine-protein kinase RsbW